nr:hypothetical protein [Tanacetum cinerariifolium]
MSRRCKEVDRLSSLPEDALSVILSLMPTKFAVQTSILSKRWRYTWTLTHNLEFEDIPSRSYSHVDRVLMLCKTTRIKIFRLYFSDIYVPNSMTVSKWISEAVRLNECPPSIYLPNLKTLNITDNFKHFDININSISCDIIFKLIDGCPLLEYLSLKIHMPSTTEDFYFKAPILKRLRLALLYNSENGIHKVVLNVPNLEYLHIDESIVLCSLFVMEDLSSLVKAKVSCYVFDYHLCVELLKGLSKVRNLTLDVTNMMEAAFNIHFPKFPHLKKMAIVGCYPFDMLKIPQILESAGDIVHDDKLAPKKPGCENDFVLLTGDVIMVTRGRCKFTTKANIAQGASAVLIIVKSSK